VLVGHVRILSVALKEAYGAKAYGSSRYSLNIANFHSHGSCVQLAPVGDMGSTFGQKGSD